jgi:hypothetical protein
MRIFRLFLILVSLCFIGQVFAVEVISPTDILPTVNADPSTTIAKVIAYFVMLTGVLTVISLTWAAIQMILAVGDDEKVKKARYMIIYSLIGLIISGIAYATVTFVTRLNFNDFLQ